MRVSICVIEDKKECAEYALCHSPFGECLIATVGGRVCWLSFLNAQQSVAIAEFKAFWLGESVPMAEVQVDALCEKIFFTNEIIDVALYGSALQIDVWRELCNIERGECVSYSDIARRVARSKAFRAVATAIGQNNISYLIPCHRVLRGDGALGGYRWGLPLKRAMIDAEQRG